MKRPVDPVIRIALLLLVWLLWWWALETALSFNLNVTVIVGAVLLVFPIAWTGRKILDLQPTPSRLIWVTAFVHVAVGGLFGVAIIRAILTWKDWRGWTLPIPADIGLVLVIITGAVCALTVLNLALKGLGAPFYIALSRRLAVDWLYAWTRNPMVLAGLAFLVSLGLWYQSVLFVLWALILVSPALLFFVKTYEERELELRFGASYLAYRSRTPMLFPRKPRA